MYFVCFGEVGIEYYVVRFFKMCWGGILFYILYNIFFFLIGDEKIDK